LTGRAAIRRFGAALCLTAAGLGLAACSDRRESTLERFGELLLDQVLPRELPPPRVRTRAELEKIRFAMVALARTADPERRTILVPVANNAGYLTYQDANRRGVVLLGGLVTATKGLAYDMSAINHQSDDPIARPVPLAEWPRVIQRNYQFTRINTSDYEVSVTCVLEQVASERIEIIERFYDVVRVQETCANPQRTFTNIYWAEPETGFIWKSQQWLGPLLEPYTVEVIRPFSRGVLPRQR